VKATKWKLHWVPAVKNATKCILREYDHVMAKEKLEDGEDILNFINPASVREFPSFGDPMLKTLQKGAKLQLERRGYFVVLQVGFRDQPMVLVETPDGRAKSLTGDTKIEGGKVTEKAKNKAEEKKGEPAAAEKGAKPKEKAAKPKEQAKGGKPADRPLDDVSRLDIRVGVIKNVWPHPEADKLWCEEIDLGEGQNRTIASGLREYVPESEMRGARVVVLCNLKPRNMKGFQSQGMVLCAATEKKVELLVPPEGVPIGERITVEGYTGDPDEKLNEKEGKAPLVKMLPDLKTNGTPVACFKGIPLMTSKGPLKATMKDVAVR
jgi:methionine--tRNA ligase beta chain